jgi:hypothetical protein
MTRTIALSWPFILGFALVALFCLAILAATVPAQAQSCVATIRAAVQGKSVTVPQRCWRLGPLTLGMTPSGVEAVLGPPDATQPAQGMWQGKYFPAQQAIYVYPREFSSQLKQHPVRPVEFHPQSLGLVYYQNRLREISMGGAGGTYFARCTAPDDKSGPASTPTTFPYSFYGIALGAPRDKVIATFGPFLAHNDSNDFWNYWTAVPLSVVGEDTVSSLEFASSLAFTGTSGVVNYIADQDPTTCRIRGFHIKTDR